MSTGNILGVGMSVDLDALADAVHQNAKDKGWYPFASEDAFVEATCNNIHDEVSELHEAWRNNQLRELCDKAEKMRAVKLQPLTCLEEELADIIIRALDTARALNVNISRAVVLKHFFNTTRPHRHGGKRS